MRTDNEKRPQALAHSVSDDGEAIGTAVRALRPTPFPGVACGTLGLGGL